MIIKLTASLIVSIVLSCVTLAHANLMHTPHLSKVTTLAGFAVAEIDRLLQNKAISIKKGMPYEESKDPALRRGTENWEEKQSSFFVVPGLFIGVVLLFYFFGRLK